MQYLQSGAYGHSSLSLFLGLCRHLHYGRTSDEFHVTPSALSRAIQRLEDDVGHRLFDRDNRSVALTPQGEIFREFATETLNRYQDTRVELGLSKDRLQGTLTLFASVTASQTFLPEVLSRFRARHPDIHLQLETGYAVSAIQRLREGADVVVAALPLEPMAGYEQRIIMSIPMLTVAPADAGALSLGSPVDWSRAPLILPTTGQARDNVLGWLREGGIRANIYSEVPGNEATLSLVALGCGVGFVPELVLEGSPLAEKVQILADGPVLEDFHVGFCTRERSLETSPLVRALWESV
ncbi:MAG: HTH-type transcriptional activator IlvY [Gammaproteobacteria bacterium]|nr:HTH-type transcriptional activator IlvY [Gammaproteobacteria bacterium]